MTRSTRRRSGLTLLTLLVVQSVAAPLGACAQEHEGHEGAAHEMEMGHAPAEMAHMMDMGSDHAEESHHQGQDSAPVDCTALTACGAPAIGTSIAPATLVVGDLVAPKQPGILDEPAAIVLALTTPPPKI